MQIDFHHAVTYVVTRLAGFDHGDATTVAHAAQYVDDATNAGLIRFTNKAMYQRIASAHRMLDYRNLEALANHQAWIPFHFLPGNEGRPAGANPGAEFRHQLVCRPDSHVARDMVRACIADRGQPNALHRLGITLHVYADTWAHQGFSGINDRHNLVKEVRDAQANPDPGLLACVKGYFQELFDETTSEFVGDLLPLGHGAALSYPDRPYLKWHYTTGEGQRVERDNPRDFLQAAEQMCRAARRFRLGDADVEVDGLPEPARGRIDALLRATTSEDGEERHRVWLQAIAAGQFGFPGERLHYRDKGPGSWKHQAIGDVDAIQQETRLFEYRPEFLDSDWKRFHDALQAHRFAVIHEILPRYGICAA